ncbi:DHA2 family efflux MFS transporter permease subunit [Aureivirga sp. CE67]|uniref:DHA2 family efflux MFS transporter permease subunit n=1 Tax=Aureivirga sp. CE67 TaxID=1788983 RepID=UPI0018CA02A4|nr:DHA2 family efflux MFS transporter permease subunit [Aureivirga sp. CE67]
MKQNANKWIITVTVVMCSIIELIDISIVNVALYEIMGGIGATLSEVTWVIASYAIGNVIMIPLTGWFTEQFGRRPYFLTSIFIFTICSLFCGFSTSLWELVFFRFFQGLAGGALLTTSQSTLVDTFPKEQIGLANGIFGLGIVMGPTLGPTLGGYLVDNLSWNWIFFINVPIGILAVILSYLFIPNQKGFQRKKKIKKIDWFSFLLLIVGLGCLQTVLEKGQQDDWFNSAFIRNSAIISFLALVVFVYRQLKSTDPVVDLKILRFRNVGISTFMTFLLGFCLFSSVLVYPVLAEKALGYTATETGVLLIPGAFIAGLMMPITGHLTNKVSVKMLMTAGLFVFFLFTFSIFNNIGRDVNPPGFLWPLVLRGIGLGLVFVPLTLIPLQGFKGKDVVQAAGLSNMARQIGGSFGIAVITNYLMSRSVKHQGELITHLDRSSYKLQNWLENQTNHFFQQGFTKLDAKQKATALLHQEMYLHAELQSFMDAFLFIGIGALIIIPFVFMLKKYSIKNEYQKES